MSQTPHVRSALATVKSFAELSGQTLAYMGDAVIELLVRRRAVAAGITDVGELNAFSRRFVTASAQSSAVGRMLPSLSEEEESVYKRGRNAHGVRAPKNATTADYRRATGMEALFGYLFLSGQSERVQTLFDIAYFDIAYSEVEE